MDSEAINDSVVRTMIQEEENGYTVQSFTVDCISYQNHNRRRRNEEL